MEMRNWDSFLPIYMRGPHSSNEMNGHGFLALLAGRGKSGFANNFARICLRLELGGLLSADELKQLYTAALLSALCSISFNGLGGCGGEIKPEMEFQRTVLERDFMQARADLFITPGWRALRAELKESAERIFLRVVVAEQNLMA